MENYSRGSVVLLPYPFTNLMTQKVRPAVVVGGASDKYSDIFIVPLTSRIDNLGEGEFVLEEWQKAGLNKNLVRIIRQASLNLGGILL